MSFRGAACHAGIVLLASGWLAAHAADIRFNRDVRPILSENCFPCHGANASHRKAKLRLDIADGAKKEVLSPGKPQDSELVKRVFTSNPDDQMPPPDSNHRLTDVQKGTLRAWIAGGAKYEGHWAFQAPVKASPPAVRQRSWVRNPIDAFVLAGLEAEKLKPARAAPLEPLLRRLSFDLTGLPADPKHASAWLRASDPVAAAADALLASPHFGERMAADWMDVARYADTHGFNNDSMRSMWRWRDWVIEAFNRNLPYDRFITEQLAGDLLEKPSLDQLIATGFNRNHVINSEGGIIDEEYRVEYVADRARTTSLAWMGLTMECARCHDHKFDPITQRDYYRFFAFFNNVEEYGEDGRVANASPMIPSPTQAQQEEMQTLRAKIAAEEKMINRAISTQNWATVDWQQLASRLATNLFPATNEILTLAVSLTEATSSSVSNTAPLGKPFQAASPVALLDGPIGTRALQFGGTNMLRADSLPAPKGAKGWAFSAWVRRDASSGEAPLFSTASFSVPESSQSYGNGVELRLRKTGELDVRVAVRWPAYAVNVVSRESIPAGAWHHVLVTCDGSTAAKGLRLFIDGEECGRRTLHDDLPGGVGLSGAGRLGGSDDKKSARFRGALANVRIAAGPFKATALASWARSQAHRFAAEGAVRDHTSPDLLCRAWLEEESKGARSVAAARDARSRILQIERDAPTTMIMQELRNPRPTFVLSRGQYDRPRELVQPGVPEFLLPFPSGAPTNRLGLARWLTDSRNPLTARAVVNRFWQSLFGDGLVKSSENLGFQGDWPSHPELLDWLACDFIESGWDVKRLLKLIVTSATYRQDSRVTPELAERDPENRLLARGPRQRLTAEMIRDQALVLSGLFQDRVGGPPVYPYQPTNLYKGIVVAADYPGTSYIEGTGADLYRRSLYTFWKRTVPHPSLTTFDAPDREVCVARRLKTNTPLQALALMNDRIQLEAAARLGRRMIAEGGPKPIDRITFAFHLATARNPESVERQELSRLMASRLEFYNGHPDAARALLQPHHLADASQSDQQAAELAACANIASLILNLDETISKN